MSEEDSENSVLLGILEVKKKSLDDESPYLCKVGGSPGWYHSSMKEDTKDLKCQHCLHELSLVVQVYAPIQYPRSLYIFGCTSSQCQTKPESWQVFRDYMKEEVDLIEEVDNAETDGSVSSFEGWSNFSKGWESDDEIENKWVKNNLDLEALLEAHEKVITSSTTSAIASSRQELKIDLKLGETKKGTVGRYEPILMRVEEEVEKVQNDFTYEESLYHKYLQEENEENQIERNNTYQKIVSPSLSNERYERTASSEKYFLNFKERLLLNPSQVLRYHYNGNILWPVCPSKSFLNIIPICACGKKRVFECQLMPALNNYLSKFQLDEPKVGTPNTTSSSSILMSDLNDWQTILIFVCPDNCTYSQKEYIFPISLKF